MFTLEHGVPVTSYITGNNVVGHGMPSSFQRGLGASLLPYPLLFLADRLLRIPRVNPSGDVELRLQTGEVVLCFLHQE